MTPLNLFKVPSATVLDIAATDEIELNCYIN